ncbi:hypothetical protein [Rhodobacter calidifons]|uniref:Lipoprotein n=1 Tax=Rhodobacter calidifons TaxID=2715277 RepID=A0ABX0G4T2_9RHOB|nr:hypothetical protein [Rhodobacter calidifons]NHB76129.1 hypothetical protein [Rhodobacter calidifons]
MRRVMIAGLLAGCAAAGQPPVPQAARLSADVLTLTLADGTTCRARWAEAGGTGRMDDCGPGFGYAVRVVENPNILRRIFTGLTAALGAEGAVAPMAEVVITDARGRAHVFVSPPPADLSDD